MQQAKTIKQRIFNFVFKSCLVGLALCTLSLHAEEYSFNAYSQAKKNNTQIVLHFFADWCPTCHAQKRSLRKIEEAGKLKPYTFFEVNFDQEEGLKEDLKVFSQSTFVAFRGDKEVGRLVGNTKEEEIESFLKTAFSIQSLNEELQSKSSASSLPHDKRKIMETAEETLRKSDILSKALKVGDKVPDFTLPSSDGKSIQLSAYLAKGPVVLSFYRGAWCPYCNLQLRAYQKILPQVRSLGAELIAITPEKPDLSLKLKEKNQLEFPVVTDSNNKFAQKLGLVFGVPKSLKKLYLSFGIDLDKSQGNPEWKLPIPATYVINQKGEITYAFLNVDYKKRAEPEDILKALIALQPSPKN